MQFLFAAATPNLFQALGINGKLLIEQAVAFLILVGILGKFVYPALIKSIDDRRRAIESGLEEARKSQELLEQTEAKVADMLKTGRKDADQLLARAHTEALDMVAAAEAKAKQRAEQIIHDAHTQLDADLVKARAALKHDTMQLVALATERIIGEKLDVAKDSKLIERSLQKTGGGAKS